MDLRSLPCGLCDHSTPVRDMKYHRSGEYLICGRCFETQQSELQNSLSEALRRERQELKLLEQPVSVARLIKYRCSSCRYSFTRKQGFSVLACPYCGRSSLSSFTTQLYQ